jgi:hypothetical protein
MIDTDKYEGHTPAPWLTKGSYPEEDPDYFTIVSDWEESVYCRVATVSTRWSAPLSLRNDHSAEMNEANARLIRDAPLLLAEVKRLREENKLMVDYFRFMRDGGFTDADWRTVNEWIGDEEE